jgi:hypothetical protein
MIRPRIAIPNFVYHFLSRSEKLTQRSRDIKWRPQCDKATRGPYSPLFVNLDLIFRGANVRRGRR